MVILPGPRGPCVLCRVELEHTKEHERAHHHHHNTVGRIATNWGKMKKLNHAIKFPVQVQIFLLQKSIFLSFHVTQGPTMEYCRLFVKSYILHFTILNVLFLEERMVKYLVSWNF